MEEFLSSIHSYFVVNTVAFLVDDGQNSEILRLQMNLDFS
ncbi:hypothetical protein C8N29_1523 [Agitococcus lubricus]|uniref:Uncharacterized protein n=1 Tax=Agitococcus lubricus TaxID=1077255 RepID=A0A2T5INJ2_9GAMM|nr:hypothetical protein C8N29_1523 [Agitococcus lubricus]